MRGLPFTQWALWLQPPTHTSGLRALASQGWGREMLASTHPSSGRVDSVKSFHSAQKASLRSWSSSDTWQLSSEVAMIVPHSLRLCWFWVL